MSMITRNLSDLGLADWRAADAYLGSRTSRKIANNTVLHRIPDVGTIAVRHFETDIVTFEPQDANGRQYLVLRTGGWYSVTTKERLNALLQRPGYRRIGTVGSTRGVWYYSTSGVAGSASDAPIADPSDLAHHTITFFDGLRIDAATGAPINGGSYAAHEAARRNARDTQMLRRIKRYVDTTVTPEHLREAEAHAAGDCLLCLIRPTEEGAAARATGHLHTHLEENYLPFALIRNAYIDRRYGDPKFVLAMDWEHQGNGRFNLRTIKRNIALYLKARLLEGPRTIVSGTRRTANTAFGGH